MFLAGSGRWNTLKNYDDNTISVIDTAAKTVTAIRPIALVYRGPAGCADCSEKVAVLLESDPIQNFNVIYVGPNEKLSVQDGYSFQMRYYMRNPEGMGA